MLEEVGKRHNTLILVLDTDVDGANESIALLDVEQERIRWVGEFACRLPAG